MILKNETDVRRVAIYVFYDKYGIVDDYVIYFLSKLKKHTKHLLVVVNGYVNYQGYKKLRSISDDILMRPNVGYDITGYKEGIRHITWDKLNQFDECIFSNSTLFGPFYPFDDMFETMDAKDLDFWGITKFHECEYTFKGCKYNYTPEHIQSSFLVIRRSMGIEKSYQDVWNKMPPITCYEEAIGIFELPFTKESKEKGFKAGVYIDTTDLEGYTRYPLMMLADELIIKRKCPVMKQKSFSQWYFDILDESLGNATMDAFDFIRTQTQYNVDLIWDNILRLDNMADIKNHLKCNFILPKNGLLPDRHKSNAKIALIMHLYYEDQLDNMFKSAEAMPKSTYVIAITPNLKLIPKIKQYLENTGFDNEIVVMKNQGRDVSALLVASYPKVMEFDYVCFIHDKKSNYIKPYNNGRSFLYQCIENVLGSSDYVENIISTFDENPRLGMLMPPPPCHGDYYQIISSEWAGNFKNTLKLAKKLNLHVNIDGNKPPITPLGTMFWFRPKAMKTLFSANWSYDDFPPEPNGNDGTLLHAIERIYGIVCQNDGYYPAWSMTDRFASIYINNLYFMLRELNLKMFPYFWPRHIFDMVNRFDSYVAHIDAVNRLYKITHPLFAVKSKIKSLLRRYLPRKLYDYIRRVKQIIIRHKS